jgi:hypothetical protein
MPPINICLIIYSLSKSPLLPGVTDIGSSGNISCYARSVFPTFGINQNNELYPSTFFNLSNHISIVMGCSLNESSRFYFLRRVHSKARKIFQRISNPHYILSRCLRYISSSSLRTSSRTSQQTHALNRLLGR